MPFATTQAAFAAALLHADLPIPDNITTARGAPDAARFAVYRNNVFVSLTKALAQRFPVTERLVGAEFFAAMARPSPRTTSPPRPLLMELWRGLSRLCRSFGPAARLPYLPDVARIEAACTRAYHAADAVPLDLADLAGIVPERPSWSRLVRTPVGIADPLALSGRFDLGGAPEGRDHAGGRKIGRNGSGAATGPVGRCSYPAAA